MTSMASRHVMVTLSSLVAITANAGTSPEQRLLSPIALDASHIFPGSAETAAAVDSAAGARGKRAIAHVLDSYNESNP
jgi:hypothetical protein